MSEKIKKILDCCKARPLAVHEHKDAWEADIYTIGKKMFALIGTYKDGRPMITLKSDPGRALELRDVYENSIIPGYYSNKKHWNSVFLDTDLELNLIYEMIDASYTLVFKSLTRKERTALEEKRKDTAV